MDPTTTTKAGAMRIKSLKTMLAVGALSLATAAPASADVQTFTIINQANIRPAKIAQLETALEAQANQLSAWWHTPAVTFGTGGWPIYLWRDHNDGTPGGSHFAPNSVYADDPDCGIGYATPCIEVGVTYGHGPWTVAASHEMMEALVDPTNLGDEVADPVENTCYRLRGVMVSDFVTPWWFRSRHVAKGHTLDQHHLLWWAGEVDVQTSAKSCMSM